MLGLALDDPIVFDHPVGADQRRVGYRGLEPEPRGGGHVAGADHPEPAESSPRSASARAVVPVTSIDGPDLVGDDQVAPPPRNVDHDRRRPVDGDDHDPVRARRPDAGVVAHVRLLGVVVGQVHDVRRHVHEGAAAAVHDRRVQSLRRRRLTHPLLPRAELRGGNHLPRVNRLDGHGSS